jgi:multicomponent Na+:H+ antiporter subunit G
MDLALDVLSWLCLVAGVLFGITAGIGLLRLPDLFTRMHAAGIGDTLAAGLIVLGLMLQAGLTLNHGGLKPLLDPGPGTGPGTGRDDASSKT